MTSRYAKNQEFECPRGEVTPSFKGTLATTALYGRRIAPLPKKVAAQAEQIAKEMRLTFEPDAAPHIDRGLLATVAAAVAPVHGEPGITRQAYHMSSGANEPPVHRIVIHTAECACDPGVTVGIGNYFAGASSGGSAHYGTDPTTEGHWVHEARIAWHAPPNPYSVGIEIAGRASFTSAQWQATNVVQAMLRAAARTADLCHRYGIPVVWLSPHDLLSGKRGITGHVCVSQAWHQSDHTDPGANFPVLRFLAMVNNFLGAAPAPAKPNRTVVKGIQTAVHDGPVNGKWDATTDLRCGRVRDTHPASSKAAIRALQKQLGLARTDGIWGPITDGAVHKAISGIQKALKVTVDGSWGPKTQSAYAAARKTNFGR